ncbi:MAG: ATP-binding protein [Eubacterium sp.]|nr:ATP-binding protein [Eubacterium sp.]
MRHTLITPQKKPPDIPLQALTDDVYLDPSDGLLHCCTCHMPRQKHMMLWGKVFTPSIPCLCQQAEREAEERRREEEEKELVRSYLRSVGLGWTILKNYRFDHLQGIDPYIRKKLQTYAERLSEFENKGLILWGQPGTGKTFAAGCIINQTIDNLYPAAMVSFRQLLSELSALSIADRKDRLDRLFANRLICLDDLDLQFVAKFDIPLVMDIADRIDRSDRPVIITTRYTIRELNQPQTNLEQKVFPILLTRSVPLHIQGDDLRKKEQENTLHKMQESL